ncbi:MAG: molybdopterin-dependent oxidoreductase [Dehalobacterium sp.]
MAKQPTQNNQRKPYKQSGEKIISTVCPVNCDSRCRQLVHVKDSRIIRISPGEIPGVPGYANVCLRGNSMPVRAQSDDRVKYPLKRVGQRGEGKFERITWEEALDTIAQKLTEVKGQYSSKAAAFIYMTGNLTKFAWESIERFAKCYEGTTYTIEALMSDHGASMGDELVYGQMRGGNDVRDYVNSKMIICWGKNPAETQMQDMRWILDAKQKGTKLVVIDPRMSGTASVADQWIPIRPATDTALALGMINVIISRGLHDEEWLKRNSCGALLVDDVTGKYLRDGEKYLLWDQNTNMAVPMETLGTEAALTGRYTVNGLKCRPSFEHLLAEVKKYPLDRTSELTGLPADIIESFAIEYATTRPATIFMAQGTQRIWNSHNPFRAITTLGAVCGYIGMVGGGVSHGVGWGAGGLGDGGAEGEDPFDESIWANTGGHQANFQHGCTLYDHITKEEPYPIKFAWVATFNWLNQGPDANRVIKEVFPKLSFIVNVDPYMNWTAKYADIVLPCTTHFENWDVFVKPPWLFLQQPAIPPVGESKSDVQIFTELAKRVGLSEYWSRTDQEWVHDYLDTKEMRQLGFDWDKFVEEGVYTPRGADFSPPIDFRDFKFTTPTTKFEFYSERLTEIGHQVPIYTRPLEDPQGPLGAKYPLVLIQFHDKSTVHSQHTPITPLKEVRNEVWIEINPKDAKKRGIKHHDVVRVFNDRGECKVRAFLTEGIVPGIVAMPQGWTPDYYVEGHLQMLTHLTINPNENFVDESNTAFYDVLVEVEKA